MATYGLTFLEIINRVLVRLRESTVASHDTTDYSTHIGQVVNQVKSEIEEARQWHALRDTFQVATTNSTASYSLTNSGAKAEIIDAWNTTQGYQLRKGSNREFNTLFFGAGSAGVATGRPDKYLQAGLDSNLDITVDVHPVPITGQLDTLKFNVYVPQDDLAASATVPLVPQNVLIEETIARMLFEKGEEGAQSPQPGQTFIRMDLLSAAILQDLQADPDEADWEPE